MPNFTFSNHKTGFTILLIIFFLAGLIFAEACTYTNNSEDSLLESKLIVSASIFPIYDLVRQIADGKIEVNLIIKPGESPHTYTPTIKEQTKIQKSRLIFLIGHKLDDWLFEGFSDQSKIIILDQGINLKNYTHNNHNHKDVDPHYWLDPKNAEIMTQVIANQLSIIDPSNSDFYNQNAQILAEELRELSEEMSELLKPFQSTPFISLHDAWAYFTKAFNLQIKGSFEPTAAEQPSPKYLKELQNIILAYKIKTIFLEPQLSTSSLQSFINDNHLTVGILDPLGGIDGRNSYQELIRFNCLEFVRIMDTTHLGHSNHDEHYL